MKNSIEIKRYGIEQKAMRNGQYAYLTYDDFLFDEGKRDAIFVKLQIVVGKAKKGFKNCIESH